METFKQFLVSSVSCQIFAPPMNEEVKKILNRCERLFMKYGIKSVTMDDVARELGVSKKTLYQYFENKEQLIQTVTENHFKCQNEMVQQVIHHSKTAIDEMYSIAAWMNAMSKNLNPALLYDLRKYHPESWQVFIDHRNNEVLNSIRHNLERGINEGLYRADLDIEVIARIYITRVEMFIDNEIFPLDKFSPERTFNVFIDYHLRGIATPKGIKYLEQLKSQNHGI
ncbi:MAG TPA: TetR/AcrR family transcriptional regulator [Chitinophagales bacterium]|nr:TetR/AcrR family transcriptional regulator [Chitinophagales bacterium]HNI54171.1 TetR/AcrR family transcriptional regulator [Chitinophagales bacterium]HNJ90065.1 TetR/AcrR family transcriptional regulator [Chitinophagales bacterium]HNK96937.1 TetR/AcrR family transcriptional regulator [Chitinophagales bacterium]